MIKNYTKVQLPNNYAWQLLDNQIEFELSKDVGVGLIQKLVELYALGVEYYESMHSYKYLYFQKKMTNLMTNPSLTKLGDAPQEKDESPTKQQNMKVKQKQNEFQKKVLYKAGDVSQNKVKDIVRCKQKQAQDFNKKVKQTLGKQADNIKQKLLKRRQANQLKMSQSLIELTTHSSESSLEMSAVVLEKPKIKVDFTNIINQNEEQDQSIYDNDKSQNQITQPKHQTQQKPIKTRGRTKTNSQRVLIFNITSGISQNLKRPKSLQARREQQS